MSAHLTDRKLAALIHEAAQAHTSLCVFDAARAILESGALPGPHPETVPILRAIRTAKARLLRAYDGACAKIERHKQAEP